MVEILNEGIKNWLKRLVKLNIHITSISLPKNVSLKQQNNNIEVAKVVFLCFINFYLLQECYNTKQSDLCKIVLD